MKINGKSITFDNKLTFDFGADLNCIEKSIQGNDYKVVENELIRFDETFIKSYAGKTRLIVDYEFSDETNILLTSDILSISIAP